jgi:hypothetical protein
LVDGLNAEVYDHAPGPNGVFDGCVTPGDDQVTHFDTTGFGIADPEAIVFNPDTGTLFISGHNATTVVEITVTGSVVTVYDINPFNISNPSGLAYAPSSVNPAEKALYISARGGIR